ncbi:Crp/Fnr family transcriptional regulator [Oricola indica]|uniref:Crp/Fnr family transcriptional regulator n=1 Tax=Oricola indica TaxID=2872591 RepID=UPI003CCB8716
MQIASSFERDRRIFGDLTAADARALAGAFEAKRLPKTYFLARQGEPDAMEYILLSGKVVSLIGDADGREVCVGFFVGPCVITPNLARAADGKSLVSLRLESDGQAASVSAAALLELMRGSSAIEEWANAVLRAELERKTSREWSLAALKARDRLEWFRRHYPDHEALFAHSQISSFLGMTPVTLSRLRNPSR